jgi:hypothetical protein
MVHPSDGEAWKYFNIVHPQFSVESRNVHLELSIDGFKSDYFLLLILVGQWYSHGLQLVTWDVYEVEVHVLIKVNINLNNFLLC